jgi:hypothetical protein
VNRSQQHMQSAFILVLQYSTDLSAPRVLVTKATGFYVFEPPGCGEMRVVLIASDMSTSSRLENRVPATLLRNAMVG